MAKFYGQVNGGRGTATRTGTQNIRTLELRLKVMMAL